MKSKNITVIPATRDMHTRAPKNAFIRRRVAAYARVSTDSDEQFTSYEAQVDYYTKYIKSHGNWEFVKVYTDEGITGCNTKKRNGFNEMVRDALDRKIDLIVTKSVSRFARNTVDSLTTVRKLKEVGCEIYFEKEGIFTFDSKGELLITIMSSLAQEESRSISENVTWGQRKRFSDGKVSMPYGQFLGYKKGADGQPEIVPDEAKVVKRIYRMFLDGRTPCAIARVLTSESIPTPGGKTKWQPTVVRSILTNEKYKGAALLQKKFTVDFLTKKQKVNEGEVPQYYVENSHPAIIPPEEWDLVQAEFAKRKEYESYSGTSIFSSKIFCGDCGKVYGPKVWHSADKYRRTIWQCNDKFKGEKCSTPHLTEEQIKEHFMKAYGQLLRELGTVIDDCRMVQAFLCNTTELIDRMRELESEITVVENMVRQLIEDNSLKAQNQNEYYAHYETLSKRLDALHTEYEKHKKERIRREHKHDLIERFICILKSEDDLPMEFDDNTFLAVTDRITVFSDEHLEFTFLNGVTFTTQL